MNLRKDHYRNGLGEATSRGRPELERAFDISSSLLCKSDLGAARPALKTAFCVRNILSRRT